MRCKPGKVISHVIVGAVVLAGLNIFFFLISTWTAGNGSLHHRPVRSYEIKLQYHNKAQEDPAPQPTSPCPGLGMSHPQEGLFQTVVNDQLYVYSAFLDKDTIRIIALRRTSLKAPLKCQIWYQSKEVNTPRMTDATPRMTDATPRMTDATPRMTDATVENLPEDHERRFTAAFIICRLPSDAPEVTPLAVSVLVPGDLCPNVTNTLLVQPPGHLRSEFTVCVTPLNLRYSRAFELVEWIELNRLLGADRFVFYNHSTGPNVDQVLELYMKEGVVDVHPWKLPVQTDTWPPTKKPQIHYFAQIASLNDCLYRYQNRSRYLVYEDLDEIIIPRIHDNWGQLIRAREKLNTDVSAFIFRCVFFRKEWLSPAKQFQKFVEMYKSVVLSYTKRESVWQLAGVRSKFIVNPRMTSAVGVHQVWESSSSGHWQDVVPKEFASLHHYRNWQRPEDTQRQVDDLLVAEKYGLPLVEQLEKAWSKLAGVPMDINITIYGDYV